MVTVEQILEAIKNLNFLETVRYLIAIGIYGFAKKGYEKIKRVLQDKANEKTYLFVPSLEELRILQSLKNEPMYTQIEVLIPEYRYKDLIRTGLLINKYRSSIPEKKERIKAIKFQISNRPNGSKLLKIANLPTVPYFNAIMKRMWDFKGEGYSEEALEEKFDELVQEWEECSLLVKSREHTITDIINFCIPFMKKKKAHIFLLGIESAVGMIEKACSKIEQRKLIKKYNYTTEIIRVPKRKDTTKEPKRIEILFLLNENHD